MSKPDSHKFSPGQRIVRTGPDARQWLMSYPSDEDKEGIKNGATYTFLSYGEYTAYSIKIAELQGEWESSSFIPEHIYNSRLFKALTEDE